jgi:hypothetical protein
MSKSAINIKHVIANRKISALAGIKLAIKFIFTSKISF